MAMREHFRSILFGLGLAVVIASTTQAISHSGLLKRVATVVQPASPYELLVFQRDPCTYCDVFRRDVLPRYQDGKFATEAPIRFVDIDTGAQADLALSTPLTVLPTAIVLKNGIEIARIPGYTGPDNFLRLMGHILAVPKSAPK
jgi:thioredoxin-related protein